MLFSRDAFFYLALFTIIIVASGLTRLAPTEAENRQNWQELEPGLELAAFLADSPESAIEEGIHALRIDPKKFKFRLFNASAPEEGKSLTAKQWSKKHNLAAAINASMFQADLSTSVSLMKTQSHTNNPRLTKDNMVLVFERLNNYVPEIQLIDRKCQDFKTLSKNYGSFVQGIRMITCTGQNVWKQQPKKHSIAAIGMDKQGRVLFIHSRKPYSVHDFNNILLRLPIEIKNAMYVEGSGEAQVYIQSANREFEFVGKKESLLLGANANSAVWPLPNVIGIERISSD